MKKFVIFDCDGVLVNTEEIYAVAEGELLAEYGMSYTPEQRAKLLVGISHGAHMKRIEDDFRALHGRELPADFWDRLAARDSELKALHLKATAGACELLRELKEAGIPVAVASNSEAAWLDENLKLTGLHGFFAPHIYSREDVAHSKPAPDIYLFAAARLGGDPADGIVVEDSATGIRAGAAAGMHVIGFTGGYKFPVDEFNLRAAGAHETAATMESVKKRIFALLGGPEAPKNRENPDFQPPKL